MHDEEHPILADGRKVYPKFMLCAVHTFMNPVILISFDIPCQWSGKGQKASDGMIGELSDTPSCTELLCALCYDLSVRWGVGGGVGIYCALTELCMIHFTAYDSSHSVPHECMQLIQIIRP